MGLPSTEPKPVSLEYFMIQIHGKLFISWDLFWRLDIPVGKPKISKDTTYL